MADEGMPSSTVPNTTEEPEDASVVVFKVVSAVVLPALLLLACSLRMHKKGNRPKRHKYKKIDTLPGHADALHVERLVQECSSIKSADMLRLEVLKGIAASPVLLEAVKISKLEGRQSKQLQRGLAACAPEWQQIEVTALPSAQQQNLLLIHYQLYQEKLKGVGLSDEQLQMCNDVASLVGQLLLTAFEAAAKRQLLQPSLTLARLLACFRLGVWSWDEPECLQLTRDQLSSQGTPFPRITLSASVKSWMDAPCLAPCSTIELVVTVHREHAGPSGAPYQRMGWRGNDAYEIMEAYTVLVSRENDGSGGAKGSMVGRLEVEVEDLTQKTAKGSLKLFAPKQPGDYEMCVRCFSMVVLGVAVETVCRFTVVPLDHPLLQQQEDSDDSDYH